MGQTNLLLKEYASIWYARQSLIRLLSGSDLSGLYEILIEELKRLTFGCDSSKTGLSTIVSS